MEAHLDSRATPPRTPAARSTPRAVDLRRGRAPEVEILPCETYDFLISLHVALASPDESFAAFDIGREWLDAARSRCARRAPDALAVLGRYLGDSQLGTLHGTLISLVRQCPQPRETAHFLDWLATLPAAQLAEVLLDQEGLGPDWQAVLAAALAERSGQRSEGGSGAGGELALGLLLSRYPDDVRPTVAAVMRDLEGTRRELVAALRAWDEAVFAAERDRVATLQQREADVLEQRRHEVALEPFIEEAMRGVQWQRPAGLRRIVFAPSYFARPAVFYHYWHGTLTFCLPIEARILEPEAQTADPRAPDETTLQCFLALGDETRLRILRLLAEREMYLTELADRLRLTKATTKHHMVRLRAAGLVTLYDRERLTYYALRPEVARHAGQLLDTYLGLPRRRAAPITGASS